MLLTQVGAQRSTRARMERHYRERLAPTFTPFQFLDTGENGLSRVIAWLLDPFGSHGQGDRFLSSFLASVSVDWPAPSVARAKVRNEAPFTRGSQTRRLDVLVTSGRYALAIENKLTAIDQPGQVSDYLSHLAANYGQNALLIYLTQEDERVPSEESVERRLKSKAEREGRLLCRSYSQLMDWLLACRAACQAPSVVTFIDGMLLHVRRTVLEIEDMDEANQLAEDICGSRSKLEAALEIYQARTLVELKLGHAFVRALEAKISERPGWSLDHEGIEAGEPNGWLIIRFSPEARFAFGVGFDRARYHEFFYGLRHADPLKNHRRKAPDELVAHVETVLGSEKSSLTWPVWKTPGTNDPFFPAGRHPGTMPDFWLEMHDGNFADRIIQFIAEMERQLKTARRTACLKRYRGE